MAAQKKTIPAQAKALVKKAVAKVEKAAAKAKSALTTAKASKGKPAKAAPTKAKAKAAIAKVKAAPAKAKAAIAAKAAPVKVTVTKTKAKVASSVRANVAPAASSAPAPRAARAAKAAPVALAAATSKVKAARAPKKENAKPVKATKPADEDTADSSDDAPRRLSVGDVAPSFELPDQSGSVVSSTLFEGKPYVIYFYPKDDTPGCTRQACGFRDDLGKFTARGIEVIGVSPDSAASHTRFIDKYGLNFDLLSDSDKTLANAYGVWTKKQNYGREYMGIERSTFLVGADGKIKKVWRSVKVDGHVGAVYGATDA